MRAPGMWGIGLALVSLVACGNSAQTPRPDGAAGTGGGAGSAGAGGTAGMAVDAATVDAAVTCYYYGEDHPVGTSWPSTDRCNSCTCSDAGNGVGVVGCSQMNCWADGGQLPCTFGVDQSCNEDPLLQQVLGVCSANGTCTCGDGYYPSPYTGRCRSAGDPAADGCDYGARQFPVGMDFQCAGNCDVCHCDAPGRVSRTAKACDPSAGVFPCAFDTTYVYGTTGGSAPTSEVTTLQGFYAYQHVSTRYADGTTNSCFPRVLPMCGAAGVIDLGDILLDFLDPTVAAALGTRPGPVLFGLDLRAAGTPLTFVRRGDGGQLQVGGPCAGAAGCTEIPSGIAKLIADLTTLDQQELADINCSPWPQPGKFVCDNLLCTSGAEYCAKAAVNGARTFAACRPYPNGCTTCACVKADFSSVTVPPSCTTNGFQCADTDELVTTLSCTNG